MLILKNTLKTSNAIIRLVGRSKMSFSRVCELELGLDFLKIMKVRASSLYFFIGTRRHGRKNIGLRIIFDILLVGPQTL